MTEKEILLRELAEQEKELVFDSFSNEDAYLLGTLLYRKAKEADLPVAIDITRSGQVLFHAGLNGSSPDNDAWIRRKINTVMRFGHASYYMATELAAEGATIESKYLLDRGEFAPFGGGFPIIIKETGIVGAITVSGLADYDDHGLVVSAIREFLKK